MPDGKGCLTEKVPGRDECLTEKVPDGKGCLTGNHALMGSVVLTDKGGCISQPSFCASADGRVSMTKRCSGRGAAAFHYRILSFWTASIVFVPEI